MSLKYLIPTECFLFSPEIERTTAFMDEFFKDNCAYLTSGLRTESDQLRIIIKKVIEMGLSKEFKDDVKEEAHRRSLKAETSFEGKIVYWWQPMWSKLLSLGFLVNPPIKAVCLHDYFRKSTGENMKGKEIDVSLHSKGLAFDIGGGKNLNEVAKCVMRAKQSGSDFFHSYVVERVNNAVHVNCNQI